MLKRFISMDPLGFGGGSMNLYETFGCDPVNNTDPMGLWTKSGLYSTFLEKYGTEGVELLLLMSYQKFTVKKSHLSLNDFKWDEGTNNLLLASEWWEWGWTNSDEEATEQLYKALQSRYGKFTGKVFEGMFVGGVGASATMGNKMGLDEDFLWLRDEWNQARADLRQGGSLLQANIEQDVAIAITAYLGVAAISKAVDVIADVRSMNRLKSFGRTKVYRVEGLPNTRILIGDNGQVIIKGRQTLFVNFGNKARAEEFLSKRLQQNMRGTQIKSFDVPTSFVEELRALAVPESMARQFPNRPILVDITKAPDQFGLRADQIEALERAILQGSGSTQ